MANAYTVAQSLAAPELQRLLAESKGEQATFEVEKEKKKQISALQKKMEDALKAAQKKRKKRGFFSRAFGGDIAKFLDKDLTRTILGSFIPGGKFLTAGLKGFEAGREAKEQKSALKSLLKSPEFSKYGTTWLKDPTKSYLTDVERLKSQIDPTQAGLGAAGTQYALSSMADWGGEKMGDLFKSSGTQLGESTIGGIEAGKGMGDIDVTDLVGKMKYDTQGPLKNLMANIKGGGLEGKFNFKDMMSSIGAGEKGGSMQWMMALPSLLSMLQGDEGEEIDFDPRSYFGRSY